MRLIHETALRQLTGYIAAYAIWHKSLFFAFQKENTSRKILPIAIVNGLFYHLPLKVSEVVMKALVDGAGSSHESILVLKNS